MKRPPGLWILLSAGFLCFGLDGVHGVRATSLIFGKSTTTTTTTTTTAQPENAQEEEVVTTEQILDANSTKPTLTGNPQLDYVWDPNLPKELNGYNLSDYPFYERVPEDIDFKCDGLHDGFYASVKHKCQVYHHCLFGVRYDFLCANYTAFDQTLFNCNFVSNVDCQNSKKFWHRNDELYKTKSTTTAAPVIYNFRTPPSDIYALTPSPVAQVPNDQLAGIQPVQPQLQPVLPAIPVGRRPRPAARRPAYDYYDYEDRPIRQRPVQRPRPRPYYDDYDDYEDERYDRRGSRRRRPYNRRPIRKEKDRRRKYEYDYDEYEDEVYDDDFTLGKKRRGDKRRKYDDDYEEDDKGTRNNRRRPVTENGRKKAKGPLEDDDEGYEVIKRRPQTDSSSSNRKPSRVGGVRRPSSEIYEDDLREADEKTLDKRRKNNNRDNSQSTTIPTDGSRAVIKPVSGTLYDRPRLAPKINLPVPKNAAHKYAYKTVGSPVSIETPTTPKTAGDKEEEIPVEVKEVETKLLLEIDSIGSGNSSRSLKKTNLDSNSDETPRVNRRRRPPTTTKVSNSKEKNSNEDTSSNVHEETTPKSRTIMRTFRRPFLPSRGGSPFTARNLKPVGDTISDLEPTAEAENTSKLHSSLNSDDYEEEEIQERRPDKTKTFRVKSPLSIDITADSKKNRESVENSNTGPGTNKVQPLQNSSSYVANKSEQQLKTTEPSIEELYENYDDTLNEASPIVSFPYPKKFPTGPGSANNNYIYNNRFYRSTQLSTN